MGATADIKPKTGVVPDFLTEGPKSGDTQDNSPQLKEAADVVTSLKAAKKTKKKGNKILRYAKARWGESKVPVNGLTIDSDLKTEDFQKITHMSWLYDRRWSLTIILRDPEGLDAFRSFLESEYASENLLFWLEIESLKTVQSREQLKKIARSLMAKFFQDEALNISDTERQQFVTMLREMVLDDAIEIDDAIGKSNDIDVADAKDPDVKSIQSRKTTRTNNTNVSEGEGSLLDTVQNSILSLMAMDCFPRFLVSKYGNNYIRSLAVRNEGNDDEFINQLNAFQAKAKSVSKSDPTQAWLTKFICMAYMLPFSVTISTRVKDPGPEGTFPLSFVNPEFTRVTGYTHDETVGRNCRFLQGPKTEPEAVEKLRVGIRDGTKIHTSITNYCKDGEEFTNLLTLHPVFDKKGVHQFVVGVQYDISDLTVSKIASLSTILDFLSEKMEV